MGTAFLAKQTNTTRSLDGVAVRAEAEQMKPCEFIIAPKNCGSCDKFLQSRRLQWRSAVLHAIASAQISFIAHHGTSPRRPGVAFFLEAMDNQVEGRFSARNPRRPEPPSDRRSWASGARSRRALEPP